MSTGSEGEAEHNLFRSALDSLSANIVILNAEGTIVTTNSAWDEFAGEIGIQTSPEMYGISYLQAIDGVNDEFSSCATDGLTALLEGKRERFELEYPCQSADEQRWVLMRAIPFRHQGEQYLTVTHTDITHRKQREKALRDAYEISTAGGVTLNEKVEELLEVARAMIGTEYATFSRVEDNEYIFEAVAASAESEIETGDIVSLDELPNCKHVVDTQEKVVLRDVEAETSELQDSEWGMANYLGVPVIVDGEVYGTFCFYNMEAQTQDFSQWEVTFVDLLSNWVSSELKHRDREEKLQHLKENVTDVVWMSSPEKDEMEFISDSYQDIWGRSLKSLREDPSSFVKGIHPDDRNRVEQALTEQQTSPETYEQTYRVVHPDGEVRWIHDQSSGVYDDGELQRIVGIASDITERKEREQELAYQTALLEAQAETTIDGLLVVDSNRTVRYHNDRFLDVWGIPEETATTRTDEELLKIVRDRLANPAKFRERVEYLYNHPNEQSRDTIELADGRWLDRFSAPLIGNDGTHYGRLWAFRDITDRKAREQALEQQRDELVELQRVNTLVRQSIQALQDTSTRKEIETAVCEALTESQLYHAAWVADWTETTAGDRTISPQTAAGVTESYLEGIPDCERVPAETALQTDTVQVINDLTPGEEFSKERQEGGLTHDYKTLAAVPLTKEDTTYGVLVVYTLPNHTISETERDVLADLGQSIALAIQRVHSQRSLTAETVVSLDLRIPETPFVFGTVTAELGGEILLERRVAASDGVTIYYLRVQGVETTLVCERLRKDPLIAACSVVRDGESAQPELVEARLVEDQQLPLDVFTDYGASVTSARAVDGDISLRVELPSEVDIRTVLTAVREVAPSIELVSKQHNQRPTKTRVAMLDQITGQLTEKQETALKTAYARGYYTWPRESTMEELAETFDISAPSLHYRLRKAHDTVIGAILGSEKAYVDE